MMFVVRCTLFPIFRNAPRVHEDEILAKLAAIPEWEMNADKTCIIRKFVAKNFATGEWFGWTATFSSSCTGTPDASPGSSVFLRMRRKP